MKPSLFIGSSKEALRIAYAVQENLEQDALCTVWPQGIFELSGNTLDNLLVALSKFDFAVFVFQPDDISQIRNQSVPTVRDNVVFELGLFIGRLGKERVFFVVPREADGIHLPTDLIGVKPGLYTPQADHTDLLSALGPFCNRVREQMSAIMRLEDSGHQSSNAAVSHQADDSPCEVREAESPAEPVELETGVARDTFGNYTISLVSTVFFDNRFCSAFPGVRGLHWFNDGKEAVDRLERLLRTPTVFEGHTGHGTTRDPIWWWRGPSSLDIGAFRRVDTTRCVMNTDELTVCRMAVYRSRSYWRSFVYVETEPDEPTGLYPTSDEDIGRDIEKFGYSWEEYGLFGEELITRDCYHDGAAVIDERVVDTVGAELRIRYVSKYNFLIAAKFSPLNSGEFDELSKPLLDDMLRDNDRLKELCNLIEHLPRHRVERS